MTMILYENLLTICYRSVVFCAVMSTPTILLVVMAIGVVRFCWNQSKVTELTNLTEKRKRRIPSNLTESSFYLGLTTNK